MAEVEQRVCDHDVLKLLRAMLRAGVMDHDAVARGTAGTPQGGVVSPVLCNVYLDRLDRQWQARDGVLVRYADDLLVMCKTRSQAERALQALAAIAAGLGLELKQAKTRIVHLREGGDGVEFLGFDQRQSGSHSRAARAPPADPTSTQTERGEPLHRLSPRLLRRRADLPDPGRVGVRLLPPRHRAVIGPGRRGRAAARADPWSCTPRTTTPTATASCGSRSSAPATTSAVTVSDG